MHGIKIKGLSTYIPETTLSNEHFYKMYGKENIDGLLQSSGKKIRHISTDMDENSLTMAIRASEQVLIQENMKASDLDFIVFLSATPEYLMPSTAIKLHHALGASTTCGAYDLNSNCSGMVIALDQMAKVMKLHKDMNRALIVGSELFFRNTRESEPFAHSLFGDAACAMIIEKVADDTESDVIDSIYYTNSDCHYHVHFPKNGISKTLTKEDISQYDVEDRIINWGTGDADAVYKACTENINALIERNKLKKEQIKKVVMCQMFESKIKEISESLEMPIEKFPYVVEEIGYTGVNSPFLALEHIIKNDEIKRGDYIVIWGLGAGITAISLLLKF